MFLLFLFGVFCVCMCMCRGVCGGVLGGEGCACVCVPHGGLLSLIVLMNFSLWFL